MLFNSAPFLFVYLPIVFGVYVLLIDRQPKAALIWLLLGSLAFYGIGSPGALPLLIASVLANYGLSRLMYRGDLLPRKAGVLLGVTGNLALLGYFKYTNFFLDTAAELFRGHPRMFDIVLPIGISFYTFQQIAYIVDVYRSGERPPSLLRYALFVTIFPHLIAGPITHHSEMVPQFGQPRRDRMADFVQGLSMLTLGLAKKIVLADSFAVYASGVFDAVHAGGHPGTAQAWFGSLAYMLQIYFDFSAYSDMAIGLGRMFGLELPINFASPYKARSIVEFWRRWHITLSRFLRDYVYISLGGNRQGPGRQKLNLLATMLIGGLWHGAGWNFVLWGGLHGLMLLVNHTFSASSLGERAAAWRPGRPLFWALTLLGVLVAWVPFRAAGLHDTTEIWSAMFSLAGAGHEVPKVSRHTILLLLGGLAIALWLPNSQEIMARAQMGLPTRGYPATRTRAPALSWAPRPAWALALGALAAVIVLKLNDVSQFIYFRF